MAQHTSASKSITFLLRGSDETTPEQGLADQLVFCSVEPGLGVALALPDIDELCELPPKTYAIGPILNLGWS